MGLLEDARYFRSAIGPARGLELVLQKGQKHFRKRRLAGDFARAENEAALLTRLGLPTDRAAYLEVLRSNWTAFADSRVLNPGTSLSAADRVLAGMQTLFGQELQVGWPPEWEWRWNGTENATIFARDVRSTWEVQRLQGILPVAAAAHETRSETYARPYIDAVLSFHHTHPGPTGRAWESALELGLRLGALVQGLPLVLGSQAFEQSAVGLLSMLDRHARWLAADLSLDKIVRGNHLIGELAGLLAAGNLIPWARPVWWGQIPIRVLLEQEILRQFHSDGVSVEQSLTYEKFVLELLILAGETSRLGGEPLSRPVQERVERVIRHLDRVTAPDGSLPRVGDCDSGRGLFTQDDPHRPQETLDRARRVFGGVPAAQAQVGPDWFQTGGHIVVRAEHTFLFARGGPFGWGIPGPASHSHADWLAPVMYVDDEAVLVDPGVFGYDVGKELRDGFRDWGAHNTFLPPPEAGPRPVGMFRWGTWNSEANIEPSPDVQGILGRVQWRGERPLLWHRRIGYNQLRQAWRIEDRLQGTRRGPVGWSFHFAPGAEIAPVQEPGGFRLTLRSGRIVGIELAPGGVARIEEGWVAPSYGRREPCRVLVHTITPDSDGTWLELRFN